jgi:beta-glucosidase
VRAPHKLGQASLILLAGILRAQTGSVPPYLNPDLGPEERAADLVSRLTLEEKASQMQHTAAAIPRLGIPDYNWWGEALHGVARAGLATVFPQAIGLAASWDVELMGRVADAISTEARAKYNDAQRNGNNGQYYGLTFWSPNINIFRDPRWGRGQETYGEDPYLTGRMAVAFVTGMQGGDPHYLKTVATPKHFAVHSGPEPARHTFDAEVSEADLDNTYLVAFRASVTEGGAFSTMCAYNSVNGAPACASNDLLSNRLRAAWGFRGYVVSDCGAVSDIAFGHHFAPDLVGAVALAVKAGADLSCGPEYASVVDAVQAGLLPESTVDQSLIRLFAVRMRLGMFDPPERVPYAAIPFTENASPQHAQLALEAAQASIVLLKNTGPVLPIGTGVRSIAVLGPAADWPDMQLGNYAGTAGHIVTPLAGVRQRFGAQAQVRFALGSNYTPESPALVPPEVLQPPSGAGPGLLGEYFASGDLTGTPDLSRVDTRPYFNWDTQDPAVVARIPHDRFAVRWSGTLLAPYDGDYVVGLARPECEMCGGTTSMRLYLDGAQATSENTPMQYLHRTQGAIVHWTAGSSHTIRIEFQQDHGNRGIELVWMPPADALLAEARQAAAQSDLAIVCVGLTADLESEESPFQAPGFAFGDRTDIQLPAPQQQLVRAALDSGKPVVVVLMTGSAIVAPGAQEQAAAVLQAWYPGQEGGTAIASVLAGDYNPAGRLPVTFYQSVDQLPPFTDYSMTGRTYRYFTGQPLYGFGYGLSYSTFRYSHLEVLRGAGGAMRVRVRVTNVSARDGDEVAQLYAGPALAGFTRVHIAAGKNRVVEFQVPPGTSGRLRVGGGQPAAGSP